MTIYKCDFCDRKYSNRFRAKDHMQDEHMDEIVEEEWPRYFTEI